MSHLDLKENRLPVPLSTTDFCPNKNWNECPDINWNECPERLESAHRQEEMQTVRALADWYLGFVCLMGAV